MNIEFIIEHKGKIGKQIILFTNSIQIYIYIYKDC